MIKKMRTNEGISYKKLTKEEMESKGILGRLIGPCADFINPTRNGRKYSEKLWENVFNNPIMKEKIANKCVFGELGHPVDRTEIDMEKVAICLSELPVKNDQGQLIAVFDILNTPNGKILKTMCDYGSTVAISSRGQGDIIEDNFGNEEVDPETYECECWDVVLVPGVESARLKYMTEGLDTRKVKMKKALVESLKKASVEDRKIMIETLKDLKVNLKEEKKVEDKKEDKEKDMNKEEIELSEEEMKTADEIIDTLVQDEQEAINGYVNAKKDLENVDIEHREEVVDMLDHIQDEEEEHIDELEDTLEVAKGIKEPDEIELEPEDYIEEEEIENEENLDELPLEGDENPEEDEEDLPIESEEETDEESEKENSTDEESDEDKLDDKSKKKAKEKKEVKEAVDDRSILLINSLKEALTAKSNLENEVKVLNEKLAVSDTKVTKVTEECNKYKDTLTRLSTLAKSNKDLKENVSRLEKSLKEQKEVIDSQKLRLSRLVETRKDSLKLTESISTKNSEIKSLTESLNSVKSEYETKMNDLKKSFEIKESESKKKLKDLTENLNKSTSIKESYKKLANKVINKYIEIKADMIGLTPKDIKRKLGESYTVEDVDQVCQDLKSYQLNVSKLPFSVDKHVGIRVNENVNSRALSTNSKSSNLDDVDEDLIRLANIDF